MNIDHLITILISSCDAYSVCWKPFCYGLKKYWPDHPKRLFFITNYKDAPCGASIKVGEDKGWASNARFALEQIETPYIIYGQEDYWIDRLVETKNIVDYIGIMEADQADYIRLYPAPRPSLAFQHDPRLGSISASDDYRTSLQMAIWRKQVLLDLIKTNETPWQFEVLGSQRSRSYGSRFLCVREYKYGVSYVFTAVVSGQWSPAAYQYANIENLDIPFENLPPKPLLARTEIKFRAFVHKRLKKIRRSLKKNLSSG